MALLALSALPVASLGQSQNASLDALLTRYASDPGNSLLCEQIGIAYTRLNNLEKAEEFFRRATRFDPQRISAKKNLATVLWYLGHKGDSISLFTSLEGRIPKDPTPQLYLGLDAYDHKNMPAAALHFERAGTLASDNPETFANVAEAFIATGRSAEARQILERRIAEGDTSAKTFRLLGDIYDWLALPEKAQRAYEKAIESAPKDEAGYLAFAGFAIEHANMEFARQVVARGLEIAPQSARLKLELGLSWAIQGNFADANKCFTEASADDPKWSMPLLALGVTHLQTGAADDAADSFRKAKSVAPSDYRTYYLHAVALARSHAGQEAASLPSIMSELRRAIALAPEQAEPRIALAKAEIAAGQPDNAETELRQVLRTAPNTPGALYNLALLCRREGKAEEASRLMQTFRVQKNRLEEEENQFVLILKTID